jgi:hypothetical protein
MNHKKKNFYRLKYTLNLMSIVRGEITMKPFRSEYKTVHSKKASIYLCITVSLRCQLQHIRFKGIISARSTPNSDAANLNQFIEK